MPVTCHSGRVHLAAIVGSSALACRRTEEDTMDHWLERRLARVIASALVATALIYALWAGQARWRPRRKAADLQPLSVPVPAAVPVESTTQR